MENEYGLSMATWQRLSEERCVNGPDDVPKEIMGLSTKKLNDISTTIMLERMAKNPKHWFYTGDVASKCKRFLTLSDEEMASCSSVLTKFGPYAVPSYMKTQIGRIKSSADLVGKPCDPEATEELKRCRDEELLVACSEMASLGLACRKLDMDWAVLEEVRCDMLLELGSRYMVA